MSSLALPIKNMFVCVTSYTAGSDYVNASDAQIWFDSPNTPNWVDLHYTVATGGQVNRDTGAFHLMDDGSILISTVGDTDVPDVGAVSDSDIHDILRFVPTSLSAVLILCRENK